MGNARLDALVRHAMRHSPFYRERLSGVVGEGPLALERLPVLEKAQMMEHFDDLVTDPRLRRDELLAWVEGLERDEVMHFFEDLTLVENVDAEGWPVSPGSPGAKLLVTFLHNLVQPIIRLEISDAVTIDPEPCPCGRTLVRARAIEGRSDDVIELPARDGGEVAVHPLHFGVVTRDREVREFQVIQEGASVRILVMPRLGADSELEGRLRDAVSRRLAELGVAEPQVSVERRDELPRSAGGKLQLVVADAAARQASLGSQVDPIPETSIPCGGAPMIDAADGDRTR